MTTTTTTHTLLTFLPGQIRTAVHAAGRGSIIVSTIPAAFDHGGPETAMLGPGVTVDESTVRHDDDLPTHHAAGIERAAAILTRGSNK